MSLDELSAAVAKVQPKVEELQRFLEAMTPVERQRFKRYVDHDSLAEGDVEWWRAAGDKYKRMVARARVLASYGESRDS